MRLVKTVLGMLTVLKFNLNSPPGAPSASA